VSSQLVAQAAIWKLIGAFHETLPSALLFHTPASRGAEDERCHFLGGHLRNVVLVDHDQLR